MMDIIFRALHIAATCTSLGGLFYARMVLMPNLQYINPADRPKFLSKMIKRYSYIKWTGIAIIAITGVIQLARIFPHVNNQQLYITAFVVKMGAALGLITITAMLALPSPKFATIRQHRKFWSGVNILCGLIILIGAAIMRSAH